jgi:tRNA U34 5-methylaminomethyl-2-thiouridine-forming methyltransferase MnmC
MPIPVRQRCPSVDPRFNLLATDDGSWTLEEIASGDTFHSGCGAMTECQSVYVDNGAVKVKLQECGRVDVLEIGFGTGMSFLLTALCAQEHQGRLNYHAIERRPLGRELLQAVLRFPEPFESRLSDLRSRWLEGWGELQESPPQCKLNQPSWEWQRITDDIQLGLCRYDGAALDYGNNTFDVVYMDPFSPQSNPELWSEPFLRRMHECLKVSGLLVSYCVNSAVRRQLSSIGFCVERVPGPVGGKREVLRARRVA